MLLHFKTTDQRMALYLGVKNMQISDIAHFFIQVAPVICSLFIRGLAYSLYNKIQRNQM